MGWNVEQDVEEIGEQSTMADNNDGIIGFKVLKQPVDNLLTALKHTFLRVGAIVPTISFNCGRKDREWKAPEQFQPAVSFICIVQAFTKLLPYLNWTISKLLCNNTCGP